MTHRPSIEEILDVAIQAAREFAAMLARNQLPLWQVMFRLARRLRGIPGMEFGMMTSLRGAVDAFCGEFIRLGVKSEHFTALNDRWAEFVNAWHNVKTPQGGPTHHGL